MDARERFRRKRAIRLVDDAVANLNAAAEMLAGCGDEEGERMLTTLARTVYAVAFKQTPERINPPLKRVMD
jgi:hypothetical protein